MELYENPLLSPEERATALVDEMTVEEQIGQLKYDAEAIPRLGIPAYNWWNEGLHGLARSGTATVFPQAIGLAATFSPRTGKAVATATADEARAKYNEISKEGDRDIYKGLTLWSPNINIFRDPRWGRGHETYGEDPYLTSIMGKAFVQGLQGNRKQLKTAACAKHFAVHSGPESIRHGFDAKVSPKDLEETYLPAFRYLVQSGVESVMGAYNSVNGEPSCASPYLQSLLKEWGFDGYFVSDCWAIRDFHEHHHITNEPEESATLAIQSGCDLNCGCTYQRLLTAYKRGMIHKEDIRRAAIHVMRTRIRLGMLDPDSPYDTIPYETVCCDEHKALARKAAVRSMVLLKNNGILPLRADTLSTIAVIGPNADSHTVLEGNYNGTADQYITFLEGIQKAFTGRVLYSQGCHLYQDRVSGLAQADDRLAEAVVTAKHADVVILCVGLDPTLEGEEGDTGNEFFSGDKSDLRLPLSQRKLIEKILATGKPVVLVNASGSAINPECDADAILQAWYPGQQGGNALADILFGNVSPSGKLPVTFYKDAEALPDFADYSMKNRTYRYTTENILYPFGFGLTYSRTEVSNLVYHADTNTASVTIQNIGYCTTEDVVQLYWKDTCAEAVPNVSLCGFQRIRLRAGETKTLEIPLWELAFTAVNEAGERKQYSNQFILYAGTCQPDEKSQRLSGCRCVEIEVRKTR